MGFGTPPVELKMSKLEIDADMDMDGRRVTNLGSPSAENDAIRADAYLRAPESSNLANEASPADDHSGNGVFSEGTVGENVSIGDLLYRKSDGKYYKADADAATTMPAVALAMEDIAAAGSGNLLRLGFFRDDSWSFTVGGLLYVHTEPGPPTQTAPFGTGDQVQVVGYAVTASIIFFNPISELVEIS